MPDKLYALTNDDARVYGVETDPDTGAQPTLEPTPMVDDDTEGVIEG
jgi:hypothetical protein